jgi:hypothetical protein
MSWRLGNSTRWRLQAGLQLWRAEVMMRIKIGLGIALKRLSKPQLNIVTAWKK